MLASDQGTPVRRHKQPAARIELDNGISLSLDEGSLPLSIGRDANCDICIPRPNVSRRHCELYLLAGELYLEDTSTNGTTMDNRTIQGASVSIQSRTSFVLASDVIITVTPLVRTQSPEDQGVPAGRRQGERRQADRRQNVITINFERRWGGERRSTERRADSQSWK